MKRRLLVGFCMVFLCLAALAGCKPQPSEDLPADALYERGMGVIEDYSDADLARSFFEMALSKQPDHPGAHMGMALVCRAEFDFETALEHYEAAFQNGAEVSTEWARAAQLYASLGEVEKGRQLLERAYERSGDESYLDLELDETLLRLDSRMVTDLSPLASGEWDHLERLVLGVPNVEDYTPVSHLTQLKELELYECSSEDCSFLSGLTQLEVLWVSQSDITDLTALSGLTNLTDLYLRDNEDLIHLDGLETLSNLSTLDLSRSSVTSIEPLRHCGNLTSLDLERTKVRDLGPLSDLRKLKILDISHLELPGDYIIPILHCPIERLECHGFTELAALSFSIAFPEADIYLNGDEVWTREEPWQ